MQKGAEPEYMLPVKLLGGETEYDGFAHQESIRIKIKGGGLNFVHGGISLQEMVVPLIEYRFLRNDRKLRAASPYLSVGKAHLIVTKYFSISGTKRY